MKKIFAFLTALAMMLSLAACSGESETSPSPSESVEPTPVSAGPSDEASVEPSAEPSPTIPGPDFEYGMGSITGDNMDIYYPIFASEEYPDGAAAANEYFESRALRVQEGFIADTEDMGADEQYTVEQGYSVWYEHGAVASVLVTVDKDYGGVHPGVEHTATTVNFAEETLVTLADVLGGDADAAKEIVLREVLKQIPERKELYEDAADAAEEHFAPENFYLSEDGLVVFYQVYDLGPYIAGAQFFTIPYENIASELADWVVHE